MGLLMGAGFAMRNMELRVGQAARKLGLRNWKFLVVWSLICGFLGLVSGCSVLRLYEPMKIRFNDWVMYGGSPQRTHRAQDDVRLPIEQLWEYNTNAGFGPGSAIVADSLVFVGTLQGELHVIHIGTGKRVGNSDFGSAIVGVPVVADRFIYVPLSRNGKNLIAYDLQRGGIAWQAEVSDIETSPLMVDNQLYVTTMRGELVCVRQFTGDVAWRYTIQTRKPPVAIRSSPATDYERIFFGADDGKLYAVGRSDGTVQWVFSSKKSIVATPSVYDGRVFVGSTDHSLYCVDGTSGGLVWERSLGSPLYAAPAVDRERVYVGTAKGEFFCLDQRTGEVKWKFEAQSVISAAPLISGEMVFIGSLDKRLYALETTTGNMLWSQEFSGRIRTTPVVWKGYLIILLEDRKVVAFRYAGALANTGDVLE